MTTTAIVIARKGSKRIPGKWKQKIGEDNLIERKIKQLQQAEHIDKIVVGSNDTDMQSCVEALGATFVLREDKFCDEESTNVNEVVIDMLSKPEVEDGTIVWAHPTNPFIGAIEYDYAVELYRATIKEDKTYDGLVANAVMIGHFLDMDEQPSNFGWEAEPHETAAEVPFLYKVCGGIFIREKAEMIKDGCLFSKCPILYNLDELVAWDIDEPWQLQVARYLHDKSTMA